MMDSNYPRAEQRKYIRLDTVFPVQFKITDLEGKKFLSGWLQGYTNNISRGGICLEVNHLGAGFGQLLKDRNVKVSLEIELPLTKEPVSALAAVSWLQEVSAISHKYIIGLKYEHIDRAQNAVIMRYAWVKKLFLPVLVSALMVLVIGVGIATFVNFKLVRGNKILVEQLIRVSRESNMAKQRINEITRQRQDLEAKIQELHTNLELIEKEKSKIKDESKKAEELSAKLKKLSSEKLDLEKRLSDLQKKEVVVVQDLSVLDKKRDLLEKANLSKMYQWLVVHQNPRTGLVMSFEGDSEIQNWAFIYDQALVTIAYVKMSDFDKAAKILDFFDKVAKRSDGRFINAYYLDGSPAEYTVHMGPNAWVGIAALQYTFKTNDKSYVGLAEDIARGIIYIQKQDAQGGIKGGPGIEWYSTEHNLDVYAFFKMLFEITGKTEYKIASERVLNWLIEHTYDRSNIPIKRGKGDATIATDTYAWSIAAIGPDKLSELKMDPDRIVEFAEKNCLVECPFLRPDGKSVKIKGFDFAPERHLSRGGVISSEWTAQMVMAFRIMSDYYIKKGIPAKANVYSNKADEYLAGLANMIISSPSPSGQGENCLPYASQDYVDTGHGWMTPKGAVTGSLSGTTYTLFAYWDYNPLELKEQ